MSLTLRVTSFQKGALGQSASKVFAGKGGTIGRVKDNDWVLPDPERIISSRHAVVQFKGGSYYLTDTSANGSFHNGAPEPVGNGNQVPLRDGDRLVIGDYEIAVEVASAVSADIDIPASSTPVRVDDGFDDAFAAEASAVVGEPADDALDPLALLGGGGGASRAESPFGDEDVEGFAPSGGSRGDDLPAPSQAFVPPAASREAIPEDWDLSVDDLLPSSAKPPAASPTPAADGRPRKSPPVPDFEDAPTELAPSVTPPRRAAPPPAPARASAAGVGDQAMLAAFMRGAGLDPADLPPERAEAFMELVGQLFREMVQDLREVLLARASLKSGFRMELTMIRAAENNPLKFAAGGVDEAMHNMLFTEGSSYLPPLRAVSEGFQDIKDHQIAMMAGMQAAFRALLERFDPERLEKRFEKAGGWALLDVQKRSEYWNKFIDEYASVKDQAEEDFQNLFGADFSRAYEGQIRQLGKARKQGAS